MTIHFPIENSVKNTKTCSFSCWEYAVENSTNFYCLQNLPCPHFGSPCDFNDINKYFYLNQQMNGDCKRYKKCKLIIRT